MNRELKVLFPVLLLFVILAFMFFQLYSLGYRYNS